MAEPDKSPFPGMDPYLEKHWRDIHASLIIYARDQLQDLLPERLYARVEERVICEVGEITQSFLYPDLRVVEKGPELQTSGGGGTMVVEKEIDTEPVVVEFAVNLPETFVEIIDAGSGHRVVTVIEFLSMSNKERGADREKFLKKNHDLIRGNVNVVLIDLLRAGLREGIFPVLLPGTTYVAGVHRAGRPDQMELYSLPLGRRLGRIRIPLRPQDQDVRLDLQALVDQAYRKGRYAVTIDYRQPPIPPLEGPADAWADALLRQAGKR